MNLASLVNDARKRYLREDFTLEAFEWVVGWLLSEASPAELMKFDRRRTHNASKRKRVYRS